MPSSRTLADFLLREVPPADPAAALGPYRRLMSSLGVPDMDGDVAEAAASAPLLDFMRHQLYVLQRSHEQVESQFRQAEAWLEDTVQAVDKLFIKNKDVIKEEAAPAVLPNATVAAVDASNKVSVVASPRVSKLKTSIQEIPS